MARIRMRLKPFGTRAVNALARTSLDLTQLRARRDHGCSGGSARKQGFDMGRRRPRSARARGAVPIAAALITFAWAGAAASAEPNAADGLKLAERVCKGCHVVVEGSDKQVPAGPPTFRGIANSPGQTGQHIMNVLIHPHAPMPDIQLTTDEILSLVMYLETLRTDPAVPPLITVPKETPRPVYPEPT